MKPLHVRIAITAVATVLAIAWFCWWSSTGHQVERTFAKLSSAVTAGSASGVLDLLHADYPIRRCWPQVSDAADDVGTTNDRQAVLRGLTVLFLLQRDNPLKATCTVDTWHALDDGQVEVVATIDLGSKLGPPAVTIDPLLHHRRFVLAYTGWWSLGFRGHEPFHATF